MARHNTVVALDYTKPLDKEMEDKALKKALSVFDAKIVNDHKDYDTSIYCVHKAKDIDAKKSWLNTKVRDFNTGLEVLKQKARLEPAKLTESEIIDLRVGFIGGKIANKFSWMEKYMKEKEADKSIYNNADINSRTGKLKVNGRNEQSDKSDKWFASVHAIANVGSSTKRAAVADNANEIRSAVDNTYGKDNPWINPGLGALTSRAIGNKCKKNIIIVRNRMVKDGYFKGDTKFKSAGRLDKYSIQKIYDTLEKDKTGAYSHFFSHDDDDTLGYLKKCIARMKDTYVLLEASHDEELFDTCTVFTECESLLESLDSDVVSEESVISDLNELINQL